MKLFHFTNLMSLPSIMASGITKGEVPIAPRGPVPSAANLTTNGNHLDQELWTRGSCTNKVKIRLTVDVPESDLTSFRAVKERYQIRSSWLKAIAPIEHRKHWFFAFAGVRPDQILTVDVLDGDAYRTLSGSETEELLKAIEVESAKFEQAEGFIRLKPGNADSWLIDAKPTAVPA